jgi:response regulator of citrate/malate metabolism
MIDSPIRVLVVDDDFMVARVHAGFVNRIAGFTAVGMAHTGATALQAVDELHPDLVLLDIYLPDITGLEVLHRLRSISPDVDVLVVSAARDVESVQQAMRGGVVHYLAKPFDAESLRQRLEEYAGQRHRLEGLTEARQEDLDSLFGAASGAVRTAMPKGLTAETAALVRTTLVTSGAEGLSATECAEATGLARVSARRYLEFFVDTGRADVRPRYGTTGRPERRFHWRADSG